MRVKFKDQILDLPDGATYQDAKALYDKQYGAPKEEADLPGAPPVAPAKKGFLDTVKENVISSLNTRPEDLKEGSSLLGPAQFKPESERAGVMPGEQTGAAKRASRLLGFGQGVADTGVAAAQLLGARDLAAKEQAGYKDIRSQLGNTGYDWARLGGNLVGPAGASKLAVGGPIRQGLTTGAMAGALTPVEEEEGASTGDFLKEKVGQTLLGAGTGGIFGKLFGKATKEAVGAKGSAVGEKAAEDLNTIKATKTGSPDDFKAYKKEYGEDIYNTPGQANFFPRVEQRLKNSVPWASADIAQGLDRSVMEYNTREMQKVLKPLGIKMEDGVQPGRDLYRQVQDNLSKRYDQLLDKATIKDPIKIGEEVLGKIENGDRVGGLVDEQIKLMTEGAKNQFLKDFQTLVMDKFAKGPKGLGMEMNGQQFKNMEEAIKAYIKKRGQSALGDEREKAHAMEDVLGLLRTKLEGQGDAGKELKKLNGVYAQFKTLENASARRINSNGIFTPSDVLNESRKWNKGQFAKGGGEFQKRHELANRVIGQHEPNSGTALNAATGGIFPNIKGAVISGITGPLYSKSGSRIAAGVKNGSPLAAPIGSSALNRAIYGPSYQGE